MLTPPFHLPYIDESAVRPTLQRSYSSYSYSNAPQPRSQSLRHSMRPSGVSYRFPQKSGSPSHISLINHFLTSPYRPCLTNIQSSLCFIVLSRYPSQQPTIRNYSYSMRKSYSSAQQPSYQPTVRSHSVGHYQSYSRPHPMRSYSSPKSYHQRRSHSGVLVSSVSHRYHSSGLQPSHQPSVRSQSVWHSSQHFSRFHQSRSQSFIRPSGVSTMQPTRPTRPPVMVSTSQSFVQSIIVHPTGKCFRLFSSPADLYFLQCTLFHRRMLTPPPSTFIMSLYLQLDPRCTEAICHTRTKISIPTATRTAMLLPPAVCRYVTRCDPVGCPPQRQHDHR